MSSKNVTSARFLGPRVVTFTDDRRIGIGISYIPTSVYRIGGPTPSALLVRGEDAYGHFIHEERLEKEQSPQAIKAHAEANTWFRARQDLGANIT